MTLAVALGLTLCVGCRQSSETSNRATHDKRQDVDSASATQPAADPHNPDDIWPLFRGDCRSSGVARSALPDKLELLWTFSTSEGGFEATAAIARGMAFVGCLDGNLYALDLVTGKKRWQFATELGFLAPAAVGDSHVFIGDSDGRFYCLDAEQGKEKWRFESDGEINSGANFHRDNVLFGSQDGVLYCLNRDSGELAWKYESEDQIRCFPTAAGDRGFVAGCDGSLHVIDLTNGKEVGTVDLEAPTGSTPAVWGELALVGTEGNVFFAVNWKQANVVWQYENPKRAFPFRSSAAVTDRIVVVGGRDKLVHAFETQTGQPLWRFSTKGRVDSSPVIVGRRVFVGSTDGRLYELDSTSGKELWRFEAGGSILASPAVAAGRLVIGTDDGDLYCFGKR